LPAVAVPMVGAPGAVAAHAGAQANSKSRPSGRRSTLVASETLCKKVLK
jgi:hypothetical protein